MPAARCRSAAWSAAVGTGSGVGARPPIRIVGTPLCQASDRHDKAQRQGDDNPQTSHNDQSKPRAKRNISGEPDKSRVLKQVGHQQSLIMRPPRPQKRGSPVCLLLATGVYLCLETVV